MKVITYVLGDNDFSSHMRKAANIIVDEYGSDQIYEWSDQKIVHVISSLMVGLCISCKYANDRIKDNPDFNHLFLYFIGGWISRTIESSDYDHNYSSVSISVNDNYVWVH